MAGSALRQKLQPIWVFATLAALLNAGYGVLFTIVGDYRDAYDISETAIGWIIGVGFIVAFVSQITLGPLGDRGHARRLVFGGAVVNAVGLLIMGFGTSAAVILVGRIVSGHPWAYTYLPVSTKPAPRNSSSRSPGPGNSFTDSGR